MFPAKSLLPAVCLVLLSAACASKNSSTLASDTTGAEDVTSTESDIESLGSSFVGSDGQSAVTKSAFAPSGGEVQLENTMTTGNPGFYFIPAGCETTTVDTTAQKATYVFNGCTGPLGLVELTGTVNVSWTLAGNQLTLDYSSTGFRINRATIDSWTATAVVTASGQQRSMTWDANLAGTTGRGRAFTRTNHKVLQWTVGVPCLAVSGQSTGDILKAHLQTTITSWQRCADSCPQAGSEINVKNLDDGDDVDIKYLGGPSADLTLNGKTEEIGLACGD